MTWKIHSSYKTLVFAGIRLRLAEIGLRIFDQGFVPALNPFSRLLTGYRQVQPWIANNKAKMKAIYDALE